MEYNFNENDGLYSAKKEDIIQDNQNSNNFSNNNSFKKRKKEKRTHSTAVVIVASVLAAVIGAVGGVSAMFFTGLADKTVSYSNGESDTKGVTNVNITVDETTDSVTEAVAKKVVPSVVGIRTTSSVMNFFGGSEESTGEGSGVVYTEDGYIITNYHVIESAAESSKSKVEVFLESKDSDSYEAEVIGYNISYDLAVIKIDAKGLTPIELGDSSTLKAGQYAISVGNPGGLEFMGSVTYGIISGLDRVVSTNSDVKLIQTDAAINPGNSGGALVNTKGQLIGINSSKIVAEEFEGMGFAIPVNTVVEKCKAIMERKNKPEAYIGITVSEKYTPEVLKYYNFPVGAVVLSVSEDSPADNAGIKKGDIVTEFNGTQISDYTVLGELIKECEVGETVKTEIYRSGKYYTTEIKVGSNN